MSLSLLGKNSNITVTNATVTGTVTADYVNVGTQIVAPSGNFASVVTTDLYYENLYPPISGGGVQSVVAGSGISVDDTDPSNPIISTDYQDPPIAWSYALAADFAPAIGQGNIATWTSVLDTVTFPKVNPMSLFDITSGADFNEVNGGFSFPNPGNYLISITWYSGNCPRGNWQISNGDGPTQDVVLFSTADSTTVKDVGGNMNTCFSSVVNITGYNNWIIQFTCTEETSPSMFPYVYELPIDGLGTTINYPTVIFSVASLGPAGGGSSGVQSIIDGDGIAIDNTDPANPVVSTSVSEGFRASLSADINGQEPNVPITGTWQTTGIGDFNIAGWDNTTGIYTAQASQGIYQISMGLNADYGDGGAVIIAKYPSYTPVPIMGTSGNPTINSSYVSLTGGDRVYLMGYDSNPFTVNQYDTSISIPVTWFSIIRIGNGV